MPRMKIDPHGWLSDVRRIPSPNFDARPQDTPIDLLVIHAITVPPGVFGGEGVERLFTNRCDPVLHPVYAELRALRVSAHFFIRRDGEIVQFVSCLARAWHAGVSMWQGRERCNDFSIGIELEGGDHWPFEPAQYAALQALVAALTDAYPIRHRAGHCHIAPGRKTDPGPYFDWSCLPGAPD
jgi:AmpD protein